MKKHTGSLGALMLLTVVMPCLLAQPQLPQGQFSMDRDCLQLNHLVKTRVENAQLKEAEALLANAWKRASDEQQTDCAGVILSNLAVVMLSSGRLGEAGNFAEKAVSTFEKIHPTNDRILLRPLQLLSAARLERGDLGSARQAFRRMQRIPAETPDDRALVHGMAAMILALEFKDEQAETENLAAMTALEQAGKNQSAEFAVLLENLAALYARQKRFEDARQALDRAFAVFSAAKNTVPVDFIAFLNLRATLHVRFAEWPEAEADLTRALRLAHHEPHLDPLMSESLCRNYAVVLRKTHRAREARKLEAQAAALRTRPEAVVDVTELARRK
jgi:tetratricopeptide (TPR) repeat protein